MNLLGAFLNVPFVYFLILLGAEAMKHAQARQQEEIEAGRLARQLSDARLALLQRQLHPHFLFNALQAISTLLHRDPATADRLLVRLSDLLRAMLDDASGQTLSLRTELELTRKYLDIEQVAVRGPPARRVARGRVAARRPGAEPDRAPARGERDPPWTLAEGGAGAPDDRGPVRGLVARPDRRGRRAGRDAAAAPRPGYREHPGAPRAPSTASGPR